METYTALGSARRAAAKATLTKPSPPKTREKTLERIEPSSLNISLTTSHYMWSEVVQSEPDRTHSVDLASVATTELLDVVLNDRGEGVPIADAVNPSGKLRVPDEGVTTNELAVTGGPVDEGISTAEVEVTTAGFDGIPFHGVLWRKLTELGAENGSVGSNVERVRIGAGTPEELALGAEPGMETSWRSRSSRDARGGSRSNCGGAGGAGGGSAGGGGANSSGSRSRSRNRGGGGGDGSRSAWVDGQELHESEVGVLGEVVDVENEGRVPVVGSILGK